MKRETDWERENEGKQEGSGDSFEMMESNRLKKIKFNLKKA